MQVLLGAVQGVRFVVGTASLTHAGNNYCTAMKTLRCVQGANCIDCRNSRTKCMGGILERGDQKILIFLGVLCKTVLNAGVLMSREKRLRSMRSNFDWPTSCHSKYVIMNSRNWRSWENWQDHFLECLGQLQKTSEVKNESPKVVAENGPGNISYEGFCQRSPSQSL